MSVQHRIVESDHLNGFSRELQQALNEGYIVVSSNSYWNPVNHCVEYYAMLVKTDLNDDIPLTLFDNQHHP